MSSIRCFVLLTAASLCGCFSYATMRTAHTVDPGDREISVGAGVVGGLNGAQGADPVDNATIGHLGARYGLSAKLDIGARLNGLGAAVDLGWAFVDAPRFAMAFAPEIAFSFQKPTTFNASGSLLAPSIVNQVTAHAGLLADLIRGPRTTVTLGVEPGFMLVTGPNFVGNTGPYVGASLGYRWEIPVGDSPGLPPILTPTIDARMPLDSTSLRFHTIGYSALLGVSTRL